MLIKLIIIVTFIFLNVITLDLVSEQCFVSDVGWRSSLKTGSARFQAALFFFFLKKDNMVINQHASIKHEALLATLFHRG